MSTGYPASHSLRSRSHDALTPTRSLAEFFSDLAGSLLAGYGAWGPFLERPGNLTGPKSYFEMKVSRKVVSVMTSNEVHFVSLANNFTAQFSNLLKLPSGVENSLTGPVITGSFEKLAPGEKHGVWWKPRGLGGKHGV